MSRRIDIVTAAVAVAVHAAVALAVVRHDRTPAPARPRPIEVEFRRPAPPSPPQIAAPRAPASVPRPAPRPVARKLATRSAPRPIPPSRSEPPAGPAAKAAPVYAIAMESPTDASSPVGAQQGGGGGPRSTGARNPVGGGSGGGSGPGVAFAIKQMPEVDTDACGRSIAYPPAAERAGIEGKVRLRVALDAQGRVSSARVLRGLGYGLDQAAVEALTRRCRFTPAIASDGRPVPFVIESYTFAFELPR